MRVTYTPYFGHFNAIFYFNLKIKKKKKKKKKNNMKIILFLYKITPNQVKSDESNYLTMLLGLNVINFLN